jgi:hypothetical protein
MAKVLDLASKKKQALNSGYQKSHVDFSRFVGIILTPKDFSLQVDDLTLANLTDAAKEADINDRIFALPPVVGYTSQDTEDKKTTFGYGGEHYSGYGTYQGMFQFADSKKALQKVLSQYNGMQNSFKVLFVDENGLLWGTKKPDETAIKGFSLQSIWTPKFKFAAENPTLLEIFLSFSNAVEFNEDIHFVDFQADVMGAIPPITDVYLEPISLASKVAKFYVKAGDNEESLVDDYSTELSDPTAWVGKIYSSGAALTVQTVAIDTISGQKAVAITFSNTGYPTSGSVISIQGAALSVWTGLNIIGFENNEPITFTV